jgi:hypothetical protein
MRPERIAVNERRQRKFDVTFPAVDCTLRLMRCCRLLILGTVLVVAAARGSLGGVADAYLSAYLEMFPTRATQAGDHTFDRKLEDFSAERLQRWVERNRPDLSFDGRLDAEALLAQVERELHEQSVLHRPQRDPRYCPVPLEYYLARVRTTNSEAKHSKP